MIKTVTFLMIFLLIAGCQGTLLQKRPSRGDQAEIYLYIQPFPPGAGEPGLHISGIWAVGADGTDYPLRVALSDMRPDEMKRQRLLASGMVPPGLFTGIRFAFETSPVKEGEEETAASKASEKMLAEVSFTMQHRKAVVLSAAFGEDKPSEERQTPIFTLSVPQGPLPGFAGYASNTESGTVTVFDKRRMEVTGVIVVEGDPQGIALDQTAGRLYIALSGADSVEVVDTLTQESLGRVQLSPGDKPSEIGISGDGRAVLVADYGSDTVSFIDHLSLRETDRLRVGYGPSSVLVDAAGRRAFVFNSLSNSISVLDIGARAVIATIAVGIEPLRGAFNPRGDRLYVIHRRSPYLQVIETASFAVVDKIYAGGAGVDALQIDGRNGLIYVAKWQERMVTIFAPSTYLPVGFISTDGATKYMAIDESENRIYLAIPEKSAVAIVNLVTRQNISSVDVGDALYAVDVMSSGKGTFR